MGPREFLSRIYGESNGYIEIRPIPNVSGSDRWWITPDQWGDIEDRVDELDGQSNIYFGVAPRLYHGHGTKDDCAGSRWVIADWDKAQLPEGMGPDYAEAFVGTAVIDAELPLPHMVLWSGGGIHAYWELSEVLDPADWERLHAALPLILHSDPTIKNIDRLMRIPGYTNPKHDAQCEVVCDNGPHLNLYSADRFFRKTNAVPKEEVKAASTYRIDDKYTEYRNNGIYSEACRLHGALSEMPDLFLSTLLQINDQKCDPPLPRHEVVAILDSVQRGRPLENPDPGPGFGLSPLRHGNLVLSDSEILGMIAKSILEEAKFVRDGKGDGGNWMTWGEDSRIWEAGYHTPVISAALKRLEDEFEDIGNREMGKRAAQLQGVRNLTSVAKTISGARGKHQITANELNKDDMVIVTADGTYVDLRTGKAIPTNRSLMMTKKIRAHWRPDQRPGLWQKFLDRIMPNPEHQEYLGRVVFYCLSGEQNQKAFFLSQGLGSNGKTVFWQVIQEMMGGFAKKGNKKFVCPTRNTDAAHDAPLIACLGARLAIYEEVKEQDKLSGDLLKELSGGNQWMAGRGAGENEQQFRFTAKQSIITNQFPEMNMEDPALLNRLIVIPFVEVIRDEEIDRDIARKIIEQDLPGVLNWALSHRESLAVQGLHPEPKDFAERKREFIEVADPLMGLIRSRAKYAPGHGVYFRNVKNAVLQESPTYNVPEKRASTAFLERFASGCRNLLDKERNEIFVDMDRTSQIHIVRNVLIVEDGEEEL